MQIRSESSARGSASFQGATDGSIAKSPRNPRRERASVAFSRLAAGSRSAGPTQRRSKALLALPCIWILRTSEIIRVRSPINVGPRYASPMRARVGAPAFGPTAAERPRGAALN